MGSSNYYYYYYNGAKLLSTHDSFPGNVAKWFARVGCSVPRWCDFDFDFGNCKYRQPSARLNLNSYIAI